MKNSNRPFLYLKEQRQHCGQQRVRQGSKSLAARRRRIIAHPIFSIVSCGDRVAFFFCFFLLLLLVGFAERVAGVGVAAVRVAGVPEPLQCPDGPVVRAHLADEHDAVLPAEGVLHDERERNKNGLSSTTCGEDLQMIFKDWQSLKGQKAPKKSPILSDLRFLLF